MKLAQWARLAGVHPCTAYRWFHDGLLPVPARQLATGTILVDPPVSAPGEVAPAADAAGCEASTPQPVGHQTGTVPPQDEAA